MCWVGSRLVLEGSLLTKLFLRCWDWTLFGGGRLKMIFFFGSKKISGAVFGPFPDWFLVWWGVEIYTPENLTWKPKNGAFEDDFPLLYQVIRWFSGSSCYFSAVWRCSKFEQLFHKFTCWPVGSQKGLPLWPPPMPTFPREIRASNKGLILEIVVVNLGGSFQAFFYVSPQQLGEDGFPFWRLAHIWTKGGWGFNHQLGGDSDPLVSFVFQLRSGWALMASTSIDWGGVEWVDRTWREAAG